MEWEWHEQRGGAAIHLDAHSARQQGGTAGRSAVCRASTPTAWLCDAAAAGRPHQIQCSASSLLALVQIRARAAGQLTHQCVMGCQSFRHSRSTRPGSITLDFTEQSSS